MGATRSGSADAILSAAQQMIRERGPEKLRLAAVAEAAGVSRQTLYRWFPTKDDLLVALSQRERSLFDDRLTAALDSVRQPVRRLDEAVRILVTYLDENLSTDVIGVDPGFSLASLAAALEPQAESLVSVLGEAFDEIPSGGVADDHPAGGRRSPPASGLLALSPSPPRPRTTPRTRSGDSRGSLVDEPAVLEADRERRPGLGPALHRGPLGRPRRRPHHGDVARDGGAVRYGPRRDHRGHRSCGGRGALGVRRRRVAAPDARERAAVLGRFADLYSSCLDEMAELITAEMGSPISFSHLGQSAAPWALLDFYARLADDFAGRRSGSA